TARRDVLRAADELSQLFVRISSELGRLSDNLRLEAESVVGEVNQLGTEIVALNQQITLAENQNRAPNDLRDRRDALYQELANYVDVNVDPRSDTLTFGKGIVLLGVTAPKSIEIRETDDGWQVYEESQNTPLTITGGRLGGLQTDAGKEIVELRQSLDALAAAFIDGLNRQHAQGVGPNGGLDTILSQIPVFDATEPLSAINNFSNATEVTSGTIPITVVDQATGDRVLHEISVDIETDTLQSLATKLNVANIAASVVDNKLSITAASGYTFDFTGLPGATPDTPAVEDQTGLLAALGVNSFFLGHDAASIRINNELVETPSLLATSLTGNPGDSDNLTAMIAKRFETSPLLGDLTPEQHLADITAGVGSRVAFLNREGEGIESVTASLNAQIASISGVDPDEEVMLMLQFQRAFEASARFLSVVNETNEELMRII
ncbi:MAG: flagellar basal body rod C-terminal domain-containing protein, partial [Planctomycetota bacterium]